MRKSARRCMRLKTFSTTTLSFFLTRCLALPVFLSSLALQVSKPNDRIRSSAGNLTASDGVHVPAI